VYGDVPLINTPLATGEADSRGPWRHQPVLGENNEEVIGDLLGSAGELASLRAEGRRALGAGGGPQQGARMDFGITADQQALIDTAADFARNEIEPHVAQFEREERFPRELIVKMGEVGLLGGTIPSNTAASVSTTSRSRCCSRSSPTSTSRPRSSPDGRAAPSAGRSSVRHRRAEAAIPHAALPGKISGAHAVTEPHSGTDIVRKMETTVRRDGDGYILNGTKTWISNAGNADFFLTYGTLDKSLGMRGICAFIVDAGSKGLACRPSRTRPARGARTRRSSSSRTSAFPAANRLLPEGEGYKSLMCGTEVGRLACSARATGQIRACLDAAVEYAKQREVFDQPIGRYELVQAKIARMRVGLETSRLLVRRFAWLLDQGAERAQKERRSPSSTPPTR
jgi:alkylation response protein AidB-like acyl-CoA dehydrogenase